MGLGFFCSTSDNVLTTNRRFRLKGLSEDRVIETFSRNLEDFVKLLGLSRDMGLSIFRLGSNFIPFASHPSFREEWLEPIGRLLVEASSTIKSFGVRVTMHPAQYIVLNSPRRSVVEKSIKELWYHFWVLDTIGFGGESIVVLHVGGVFGDKEGAVKNLYRVLEENKWLTRRLALENDERHYSVREVIEIAEPFGIPVVYDHYHHTLNPSSFSVDRLIATWRGRPLEIHVSSGNEKTGRFGEHGDYVKAEDFVNAIELFPEDVEVDVIVEAKKKEYAIVRLIKELTNKRPDVLKRLKSVRILDEEELKQMVTKRVSARERIGGAEAEGAVEERPG